MSFVILLLLTAVYYTLLLYLHSKLFPFIKPYLKDKTIAPLINDTVREKMREKLHYLKISRWTNKMKKFLVELEIRNNQAEKSIL